MKTLTEFSGTIIRLAAKGLAEGKSALLKEAPVETVPTEGAPAAAPVDGEANKAALDAAVSKESGITGDRLARLREALEAVGDKTADVRLVRVYAGEEAVSGAKKVGAHHYVVDFMPQSMKQVSKPIEKDRGGRGGGDRGSKPTGGFSMDAVREDRKAARGPGGPGGPGGKPGAPKP